MTATQTGYTSDTKSIIVGNKTLASTSCLPDAPRPGDVIEESADAYNSDWGMPRDIGGTVAPDNSEFRLRVPVTYRYNYVTAPGGAAAGAVTRLTTSLVGANAGIGTIVMPKDNKDGKLSNTVNVLNEYNAYVPMPVPASGIPSMIAGAKTFYDIDASGNIVTPSYWQPKMAAKAAFNDKTVALLEFYPAGWDRTIAADLNAKAVGASSAPVAITRRRTGGGALNQYQFDKAGGTLKGASYFQDYYEVTGTLVSKTGTTAVKGGKITYTAMCEIAYTMKRLGLKNHTEAATDPGADPANRPGGTAGTVADTNAACGFPCNIASSPAKVREGASMGNGDFAGTFYTHNKVPRVIYKADVADMGANNFRSTTFIGGVNNTDGANAVAQPNATYWSKKDRSDTTHSYTKFETLDVSRDWINLP